jgi:hypothetical protein
VGQVGHDAGVAEIGEEASFAQEPLGELAGGAARVEEELEGDSVVCDQVARAKDGAHAAAPRDGFDDESVGDGIADGGR